MSSLNFQQKRRTAAYQDARVQGTHNLSPRPGHYVFISIEIKTTLNHQQVQIVKALWKPTTETSFIEGLYFELGTQSFYNDETTGIKHLLADQLIGKMLFVKEVKLVVKDQKSVVILNWDVLNEAPVIAKALSLFELAAQSNPDILKLDASLGIDYDVQNNDAYDAEDEF